MSMAIDDVGAMSKIDRSGMLYQMSALPNQLQQALKAQFSIAVDVEKVCFCGLGGSAMGGDILADHLRAHSKAVSMVVRDVSLPAWVDERTLVIAISYSGNTRETYQLFTEARERKCPLVAVTSGGKILERCLSEGTPTVKVPEGMQPRAALGHLLGSTAIVLEAAGIAPVASELKTLVSMLESVVDRSSPSVPLADNLAKKVAVRLDGRIPFIYSSVNIRTAAKRWQTQINENSKALCLQGEIPEMDHNQVVAWVDGIREQKAVPVFLRSRSDIGMIKNLMAATIDIFQEFKLEPLIVDLDGRSHLESTMAGVVLGDFVSFYMAMLKGIDPVPVSSIAELKKRLG
jgi:glucose/mannose-6-phosphate isomerase